MLLSRCGRLNRGVCKYDAGIIVQSAVMASRYTRSPHKLDSKPARTRRPSLSVALDAELNSKPARTRRPSLSVAPGH